MTRLGERTWDAPLVPWPQPAVCHRPSPPLAVSSSRARSPKSKSFPPRVLDKCRITPFYPSIAFSWLWANAIHSLGMDLLNTCSVLGTVLGTGDKTVAKINLEQSKDNWTTSNQSFGFLTNKKAAPLYLLPKLYERGFWSHWSAWDYVKFEHCLIWKLNWSTNTKADSRG